MLFPDYSITEFTNLSRPYWITKTSSHIIYTLHFVSIPHHTQPYNPCDFLYVCTKADCSIDNPQVCTYQFFSCTKLSKRKASRTSFSVLINRFARAYFHLTIHYFTKTCRNFILFSLQTLCQIWLKTARVQLLRWINGDYSVVAYLFIILEKKEKKSKNGSKRLSFFFHDILLKAQSALNAPKCEEHGRKLHGDETAHTTCSSKKLKKNNNLIRISLVK